MCLLVDGGGFLCIVCDFIGMAQMNVTLTLGFQAQAGSFTRITNFREKVVSNYDLN